MVRNFKNIKITSYFDRSRLPKILPININISIYEDMYWTTRNFDLNEKRMKYIEFSLNILGYYVIIGVPYKHVGLTYYGRKMINKRKI